MVERTFTVTDPLGIHAQPATTLIRAANTFTSEINLEYGNKLINLKSIMGVMSLGLEKGAEFTLRIKGNDEENAYQNLTELLQEEGLAE